MITMRLESIDQCLDQRGLALLTAHHDEINRAGLSAFDQRNIDRYRAIEAAGGLRIMVAREDNEQVGYAVFFVSPSNQTGGKVAQSDMYFVRPDKRFAFIGLHLMTAMITHLVTHEGVTEVRGMSSTRLDTGPLWRWLGFEMTGMIYERSFAREAPRA
jgi:hypothetical protein